MMEFYERASGARMHAAYVRPGGVHQVCDSVKIRFRLYDGLTVRGKLKTTTC